MAHNISQIVVGGKEVTEAMFAKEPAWHGLGEILEDAPNSAIAIKKAHLDWHVDCLPLVATKPDSDEIVARDRNLFGTVRTDINTILGTVTSRYAPVQNIEAFDFCDCLLENNDVVYESAFALDGGRKVVLLAKLPIVDEIADGDKALRYLLFSNSHDGSSSIRCLPTSIRVVCANTLAIALKRGEGEGITIRHVGEIGKKVEAAQIVLKQTCNVFERVLEVSRRLAEKKITDKAFSTYVDAMYPEKEGKRAVTMREDIILTIANGYFKGNNQQLPAIARTGWAAFNAVTEYVDHAGRLRVVDGTSQTESRFNNVVFGKGATVKREAWNNAQRIFLDTPEKELVSIG